MPVRSNSITLNKPESPRPIIDDVRIDLPKSGTSSSDAYRSQHAPNGDSRGEQETTGDPSGVASTLASGDQPERSDGNEAVIRHQKQQLHQLQQQQQQQQ